LKNHLAIQTVHRIDAGYSEKERKRPLK